METRELDSAPALPPLYAKAALGPAIPGGGDELPDHALELAEARDRPRAARRLRAVCGFALRDTLPPTYPHLLGFPLAMALMTEREFPFALLGMVHIANRIEQRRAAAGRPRARRSGSGPRTCAPITAAASSTWSPRRASTARSSGSSTATYLRPGKGSGERPAARRRPLRRRPTRRRSGTCPATSGAATPRVSGDRNPIHLHSLSARLFGFPSAIAHGMWTYARALATLDGQPPGRARLRGRVPRPAADPGPRAAAAAPAARGLGGWRSSRPTASIATCSSPPRLQRFS